MRTIVLCMAASFLIANVAVAGDCCPASKCCDPSACGKDHGCCDDCGGKNACQVVREMKKVKKHVWVVECEEFCPSLPGCGNGCKSGCKSSCSEEQAGCCEKGCGSCGGKDPCEALKDRCLVKPRCCKPRTRKKLIKKEVTCEVPVYKCVPVCGKGCCDSACCEEDIGGQDTQSPLEAPAPDPAEIAPPVPDSTTSILRPAVTGTSYLQALKLGR